MSKFSMCLKQAIEASGYSIYSISKEINYDRSTLTNYLNGKRKMPKDVFVKLLSKLNITEVTKTNLIKMFHKDIFETDFERFETIRQAFLTYNKISFSEQSINLTSSYIEETTLNNITNIIGELAIKNAIKSIISLELRNEKPTILFNLDLSDKELFYIIQSAYMNANDKMYINSIISFSINERNSDNNFSKFINILPLLLNGYCPYYYFTEQSMESALSLLFPYYVITSKKAIVISTNFDQAIIFSDKDMLNAYKKEFASKIVKYKRFKYESAYFLKMPYVFSNCITPYKKHTIYCFNERFCALPFLTKEHLTYMFSDSANNYNEIILELQKCYELVNDYVAFTPVESLFEFVKTGKEGHTSNNYSKPLTIHQRIEVLKSIRTVIDNGGGYYFVEKSNFFCNNLTFNLMSDSKIIFFTFEQYADKDSMFVLSTPNGLLKGLKPFFKCLEKSCYVLSKEKSLQAIDEGIKYANSLLD